MAMTMKSNVATEESKSSVLKKSWADIVKQSGAATQSDIQPAVVSDVERKLTPGKPGLCVTLCHGRFLVMLRHYGWVEASEDIDHPTRSKHDGRIYLKATDVRPGTVLTPGCKVSFYLYADDDGLGAEDCHLEDEASFGYSRRDAETKASPAISCASSTVQPEAKSWPNKSGSHVNSWNCPSKLSPQGTIPWQMTNYSHSAQVNLVSVDSIAKLLDGKQFAEQMVSAVPESLNAMLANDGTTESVPYAQPVVNPIGISTVPLTTLVSRGALTCGAQRKTIGGSSKGPTSTSMHTGASEFVPLPSLPLNGGLDVFALKADSDSDCPSDSMKPPRKWSSLASRCARAIEGADDESTWMKRESQGVRWDPLVVVLDSMVEAKRNNGKARPASRSSQLSTSASDSDDDSDVSSSTGEMGSMPICPPPGLDIPTTGCAHSAAMQTLGVLPPGLAPPPGLELPAV